MTFNLLHNGIEHALVSQDGGLSERARRGALGDVFPWRWCLSRKSAWFLLIGGILLISSASAAKADEIVFAGGAGGTVEVLGNILVPAFHEFTLDNAPLSELLINGTSVPFTGSMDIDATGTTTGSGELLFSSGTLTISSGANTEVTGQLLESALGVDTSNNSVVFLGVLDPNSTTFGDLLNSQGPLIGGLGLTDFEVELPIIDLPTVGFEGTALGSGAILVTPEPSAVLLLVIGLVFLFTWNSRRLSMIGVARPD